MARGGASRGSSGGRGGSSSSSSSSSRSSSSGSGSSSSNSRSDSSSSGRSFGSRSSSSSGNNRGSSGSSSNSSSSGSFGSGDNHSGGNYTRGWGRPPRPRMSNNDWVDTRNTQSYIGGMGGNIQKQKRGCMSSVGCLTVIVVFLFISFVVVLFGGNSASNAGITTSTINREPLPAGAVTETGYYTDELDWIGNQTTLKRGMQEFYQETGIQPYLYLTDNILGNFYPSLDEGQKYANQLYDELFTDEAHLLLLFYEFDGAYRMWIINGNEANTVMDEEAMDILFDYVEKYYEDTSLSEEELFASAFRKTGKHIMQVSPSTTAKGITAGTILLAIIGIYFVIQKRKKLKEEEEKQRKEMQEVLSTPLETFGESEAETLAKKYEE